MLVSIVSRFGNTWFLLCLEILCAHWLSCCVYGNPALSLVLLHMVFVVSGNPAFSLGEHNSFPEGVCVSGNPALSLVLLHMVFVVSGNPAFSLGEHNSFPEGGSILIVPAF